MNLPRKWSLWSMVLRSPDGVEGGGDPAPASAPAADPASTMFPSDAPPSGDPAPAPADWKEYVADPAKSDEENAAAKAEHDKTKPSPAADPADVVPEDGKYVLTMPEGVEVDQALLDAVSPAFKEIGLTTKQAQALTDKFIAHQQAVAAGQMETFGKTVEGWLTEAKADPEIGGAKWTETNAAVDRVMAKFGNDALRVYMNSTGAGNHPEVIRLISKFGAMISEDVPASDNPQGKGKPVEVAHALFPNDVPTKG